MLTLEIPTLLALLGTALMAVVIFAPAPIAAKVTMSLAPPLPLERWNATGADPFAAPSFERCGPPDADPFASRASDDVPATDDAGVSWTVLVDRRAAGCDAAARLALAEALATVRAPWADAILQRALGEELDARVRDAVAAALGLAAGER